MKAILPVIAVLLFFASCTTQKGATKYMYTHRDVAAKVYADMFPIIETTDSSQYLEAKRKIDSLVAAALYRDAEAQAEAEQLKADIERLESQPIPEDCNEITEALFRQTGADKRRILRYEKAIADLQKAVDSLKPVKTTKESTAKTTDLENQLTACVIQKQKAIDEGNNWKTKFEKLEEKNKGNLIIRIPWWLIIVIVVLGGLFLFWRAKAGVLKGALKGALSKLKSS